MMALHPSRVIEMQLDSHVPAVALVAVQTDQVLALLHALDQGPDELLDLVPGGLTPRAERRRCVVRHQALGDTVLCPGPGCTTGIAVGV
jgi:hypothetical protein